MNKGILIIDKIPEYCDEHCKFCDSFFNCQYVGNVEEAWRNKQRDPKCPIKPLPGEKHRDTRSEIIDKAKKDLIEGTNIEMSPDEMKVIDNFLFRCWQMGWLERYEEK